MNRSTPRAGSVSKYAGSRDQCQTRRPMRPTSAATIAETDEVTACTGTASAPAVAHTAKNAHVRAEGAAITTDARSSRPRTCRSDPVRITLRISGEGRFLTLAYAAVPTGPRPLQAVVRRLEPAHAARMPLLHVSENARLQIRTGAANSVPKNRTIRTLGFVGAHR